MSIINLIDIISKTKDNIDNAIAKVNDAVNNNNHPLYAAIDALLPQDYDRKAFFNSFDFNNDVDKLFDTFFNSPEYFPKGPIKAWHNRMIVLVAIAFIGLDYSGKKDEVDNIKKKLKGTNFHNFTRIGIALDELLDGATAKEIAKYYGFRESNETSPRSRRSQDRKVLETISEKLSSLIKKWSESRSDKTLKEFLSDSMDDIFFITTVIVGLVVIAGVVYKKSSEKNNYPETPEHSESANTSEPAKVEHEIKPEAIKEPIPAIMAVVIPANKLGSETKKDMVISDAIRFIDAAVYFACFPMDTAKEIETKLDLKEDQILLDSAQDIYVRLETEDGDDLIGATLKFSLKKSLRNKPRDFKITKIRLLDKLRGLDKFNRI